MASASLGAAIRQVHRLFDEGTVAGLTDGQLVERFLRRGDQAAFGALVERHAPMVSAVCRRALDEPGDRDDVVQATFLALARRASTVRGREALGAWLFVVARRACLVANRAAARRRRHERRAAEARGPGGPAEVAGDDRMAAIHEEIGRLPESLRLPVVLCLLEGRTRAEAAAQLRWTEGEVRGRLARAKVRLRARLGRRGMAPASALAALARDASAAVPRATVEASARVATPGAASAAAASIAREVLKGVAMDRLIPVASALLTMVAAAGLVASAFGVPATPGPAAVGAMAVDDARVAPVAIGEVTEVRGRVLGPDGRPVAGARLLLSYYRKDGAWPEPRAVSGPDGSFRFAVDQSTMDRSGSPDPWIGAQVVAEADGFALDWASPGSAPGVDLTLRLVPTGPEFRGRVLDLEGRPVAGAKVKVGEIVTTPGEDLTPALELWKSRPGEGRALASKQLGFIGSRMARAATTDAEGRFRLEGFGRERALGVIFEGPGIARTWAWVVPRDPALAGALSEATVAASGGKRARSLTVYGMTFDHLAAPSRPIVGVVREQGTGKPLAGVHLSNFGGPNIMGGLSGAETDDQGRYRLDGLAKAAEYGLSTWEPRHFNRSKTVRDEPGLGPMVVDFEMRRGLKLRGRLTDRSTGLPIEGSLQYYARADNPNPTEETHAVFGFSPDGHFGAVVPPGPGFVCLKARDDRYINAHTAESDGNKRYSLNTNPPGCSPSWFNAIIAIDPKDDAAEVALGDVGLDPGVAVSGTVEDPDGRPLAGAVLTGLDKAIDVDEPLRSARFEAGGIDPRRGRVLVFEHKARKLAKAVAIRGEHPETPIAVRLLPPGTIAGRAVDADGKPRSGLHISLCASFRQSHVPPDFHPSLNGPSIGPTYVETGADGRFRFEGLIDGLRYDIRADDRRGKFLGLVAEDATAPPGGPVDLGDVRVVPRD